MATLVFKDASVIIDSKDLSADVKSVTLTLGAELGDDTAMGDDTRSMLAGLKTWSADVVFHQDFAASPNPDVDLEPKVGAAAFSIAIKPTSAAVSATNPNYNGNCVLESYVPMGGPVGQTPAEATARFVAAGDLTRAVA